MGSLFSMWGRGKVNWSMFKSLSQSVDKKQGMGMSLQGSFSAENLPLKKCCRCPSCLLKGLAIHQLLVSEMPSVDISLVLNAPFSVWTNLDKAHL